MTIQESIAYNTNHDASQRGGIILYQTPGLKFLREKNYYFLDCLNENIVVKEELVSFIQFARSLYRIEPYQSLLVQPGKGSNIDIEGWAVLTKVKFEKTQPLKIAFVSGTLYQSLLFKRLQILNNNIMVFNDKKAAIQWLQDKKYVSERKDD